MTASPSRARYEYLDSIRGIAALVVLLHHALISMPRPDRAPIAPWIEYTPLRVIEAGRPAVIMFFVLSGFVLTASLYGRRVEPGIYMMRRFVRIYLPFAASIALSVALYAAAGGPAPAVTGWLAAVWSEGASPTIIVDHLLMLGRQQDLSLNPVVWSLWYELRISLVLPFLIALLLRLRLPLAVAGTAALWLACELTARALGVEANPITAETVPGALFVTLHFVPMFAAGALLFLHRDAVAALYARAGTLVVVVLWTVALGLFTRFSDLVTFPGAVLVLALCIAGARVQRAMEVAPLVWLGRISFSLYLTHVPVLAAVHRLDALGDHVYWRSLLALGASLLAADLFYRSVERPTIRLNGRLKRTARPSARPGPA